jgi:hypothetical protein
VGFGRVWCCEEHLDHLGELERGLLTEAAAELEHRQQPRSAQASSTPSV